MALPTLEKTWQYNVNQVIPASTVAADKRNLWFKIKQLLTGFASNPWTVVMSSDSITTGAGDRWLTAANVVMFNEANPHSWIVLQQTTMNGGTFQICLDCNDGSGQYGSIIISAAAGFTGGSTTYAPTATDGVAIINHNPWCTFNTSGSTVTHAWMSTDGQCTRLFTYVGGSCVMYFFLDTLADSPLAHNASCTWIGNPATRRSNDLLSLTLWYSHNETTNTNMGCYLGTECYNGIAVPAQSAGVINNLNPSYPMTPLSVHSAVANNRGRVGRVVDAWMGSTAIPDGSTFPISPPDREFILLCGYILPWNGSVPQIV